MTVKAKRGRRRYVYFVTVAGKYVPYEDLLRTLITPCERAGLRSIRLIQFDGRAGIVRSSLTDLPELKRIIDHQGSEHFRSIRTSGTLRALRNRYFKSTGQKESEARDGQHMQGDL
ncbi:MAG: hypothetical protein HPY73_07965 [Methanomassiliicoccales archaeon]|nr:MAG: hypothetical protein HPY73_07965 [Methanomassiliicoccales archaeon]